MTFTTRITFLRLLVLCTIFINGIQSRRRFRRVVGGSDAYPGQVPYVVNLRYWGEHRCGGAIIGPQWILTAAHCLQFDDEWEFKKERFTVVTGAHTTDSDEDPNEEEYAIEETITHPNYRYTIQHQYNDIGLIKLKTPIKFSPRVQIVNLGVVSDNSASLFVAGWGRTGLGFAPDVLQHVILSTMDIAQCQKIHEKSSNIVDGDKQICAYGGIEKTLCDGDSGSPLIRIETGRVVGIFTGYEDCTGHYPALAVRVSAYMDWLRNVTGLKLALDF